MKWSRRELSIDMAEHWSIVKNDEKKLPLFYFLSRNR